MTNAIRYVKTRVLLFAAMLLAVGCSKELPDPGTGVPTDGLIRLNVAIATESSSSEGVQGDTKAPVIDGGAGAKAVLPDIRILKIDKADMATNFTNASVCSGSRDASGAITYHEASKPLMKYSKKDINAWLVACHPQVATDGSIESNTGRIVWTINGKTDILLSTLDPTKSYDAGKYSAPVTGPLTLHHALAQLEVKFIAESSVNTSAVNDTWGKITKIELLSSAQKMTYTHETNALTYEAAGALPLLDTDYNTAFVSSQIPGSATTAAAGMYPPSTGPIRLKVYSEKVIGGVEVAVQLKDGNYNTDFKAGKHYVVTLTFGANDKQIGVKSTVTAWADGYTAENKPAWTPKVGSYHYTDGTISWDIIAGKTIEGVIYWVDPTDPFHFMIAALNGPPASWKNYNNGVKVLLWATGPTGITGNPYGPSLIAADGSDGIGRQSGFANHKLFRKYCAENTSGHTLADYPAAYWCEEMRVDGRGGWVLPSINELDYLYCAYSGNEPTTWLTGAGPAQKQGYPNAFDARFTEAGGAIFERNRYVTTTLRDKSYYYMVYFADGLQTIGQVTAGGSFTRCVKEFPVREVLPPPFSRPSDGVLDYVSGNTKTSGTIHSTFNFVLLPSGSSLNNYTYSATNTDADNNGGYQSTISTAIQEAAYQKLEVAKADETVPAGTAGWDGAGKRANWTTAWDACKAKAPAGAWRLPRTSELAWILINSTELETTPGFSAFTLTDMYWSGTEMTSISSWAVHFSDRSVLNNPKNMTHPVRCVREITH